MYNTADNLQTPNVFDLINKPEESMGRSNGTTTGYSCSFTGITTFQIEGNFPVGTSVVLEAKSTTATEFILIDTITTKVIQINMSPYLIHRFNITNAPIGLNIKAIVSDV